MHDFLRSFSSRVGTWFTVPSSPILPLQFSHAQIWSSPTRLSVNYPCTCPLLINTHLPLCPLSDPAHTHFCFSRIFFSAHSVLCIAPDRYAVGLKSRRRGWPWPGCVDQRVQVRGVGRGIIRYCGVELHPAALAAAAEVAKKAKAAAAEAAKKAKAAAAAAAREAKTAAAEAAKDAKAAAAADKKGALVAAAEGKGLGEKDDQYEELLLLMAAETETEQEEGTGAGIPEMTVADGAAVGEEDGVEAIVQAKPSEARTSGAKAGEVETQATIICGVVLDEPLGDSDGVYVGVRSTRCITLFAAA